MSAVDVLQYAKSAFEVGDYLRGERYYKIVLSALIRFCEKGEIDHALGCELPIYRILVKQNETEESAERYFSTFRDHMCRLGKTQRDETVFSDGKKVGFVIQTLYQLGHVECLYNLLRIRGPETIYVLGSYAQPVVDRFERIGCRVVRAIDEMTEKSSIQKRLKWIRGRMAIEGVGVSVWVSTASVASFAFGMGLARKQVLWSHRHHQYVPGGDAYICYGDGETKDYHGKQWLCANTPLIDWESVSSAQRGVKNNRFTFGTVAREEKMEDKKFLFSVCRILQETDAKYEYCGKFDPPIVRNQFEVSRVADRCKYMGWVEPIPQIDRLHAYIETHPVGGITSLMAAARGVPVVAMKSNHNPLTHNGYPVSETYDEFVKDAIKIYRDVGYRQARAEEGLKLIETEKRKSVAGVKRFFSILESL